MTCDGPIGFSPPRPLYNGRSYPARHFRTGAKTSPIASTLNKRLPTRQWCAMGFDGIAPLDTH